MLAASLALPFLVLLQINTYPAGSGPRINRDEDLRRQTEESVNRRADAAKKSNDESWLKLFYENSGRFLDLGRETCILNSAHGANTARKEVAGRANKMDGLLGRIISHLGSGKKTESPVNRATESATPLERFCAEFTVAGPNLGKLVESSQKSVWDNNLAASTSAQLQSIREIVKVLKRSK